MKNVKQLLAVGDPLAREPEMTAVDAHAMRREVVAEAVRQPVAASPFWWPQPFVMAAVVAACLVVGVSIGVRLDRGPRNVAPKRGAQAGVQGARRQLQFETPGGTRIIWTFHEHFEL